MLKATRTFALALLGAALISAPGLALGQDEPLSVKGMILSHDADRLVVRTDEGDKTIDLIPDTKIEGTAGQGVFRREARSPSDLIRGLPVHLKVTPSGQKLIANEVEFKTSDLKTARQISAGLHETEGQVAANKAAIADVGNLVAAGQTKVFFPVGGYTVPASAKGDLCALAGKAKGMKGGYRLAVVGRADPSGDAAANKRLSAKRAENVKSYLTENCGVMPGNFVPATALGEANVALDPDRPKSDQEARRVTVTIMVSKANAPG